MATISPGKCFVLRAACHADYEQLALLTLNSTSEDGTFMTNRVDASDAVSKPQRRGRGRLQFSLRQILAIIAAVGVGAALTTLPLRLATQHAELTRLREEAGYLTIQDPKMINAIAAASPDQHWWKWRVYLPKGRDYEIYIGVGPIPKSGYQIPGETHFAVIDGKVLRPWPKALLKGGQEYVVEAWVQKSPELGAYGVALRANGATSYQQLSQDQFKWTEAASFTSSGIATLGTPEVCDPTKPVDLLREKGQSVKADGTYQDLGGILIWITPGK
jgi:hypothetical protein